MAQLTIQQAFDVALQHHEAGQLREAEQLYRQILAQQPDHAEAMHFVGVIALQAGKSEIAAEWIRRAIASRPDYADAYLNLGVALGNVGRLDDAVAAYRRAIALNANFSEAYNNLGNALKEKGQFVEAIAAFERSIAINPNLAATHNNLGIARKDAGQLEAAIAAYRHAIALDPNYGEAHNNLGLVLKDAWRMEESLAAFRRSIAVNPRLPAPHSNLAYTMLYGPGHEPGEITEEHRAWNLRHASSLRNPAAIFPNDRNPERRLRIGYVSADFREHPVGRFLIPLTDHHDRGGFEIVCYSDVRAPDAITERIRSRVGVWRNIAGWTDEAVAGIIRQDRIDILVDLAGHTDGNRLLVFARKPAPVQATYLGYAATTGLTAVDYRLTDALADPLGLTETHYVERLVRLPGSAWCFEPPQNAPAVGPLPAQEGGRVTFGCFNNFAKVTEPMLMCWAKILQSAPASRLFLKAKVLASHSVQEKVRQIMGDAGIDQDRLELRPMVRAEDHLAMYGQIDIALDTYPYHGTTTTCESLWMGVPVVTRAGQSHVSRVGVSLLTNAGLAELIASGSDDYVQIAIELASDLRRLGAMRASLRQRMATSPLTNGRAFARNIEAAYRRMWRTWCEESPEKR